MAVSTKLTLSIDASVIVQAKAFARQRRKSLSRLVEEYLRYVSAAPADPPALSSRVLAVAESLPMPPGATFDSLKDEYLREKLSMPAMPAMPAGLAVGKILIDSDVILDLFIAREPHHTIALHFFSRLEVDKDAITAATSPVALANVGYVLAKLKDQAFAVGKLRELRTLIGVAPISQAAVDRALARPHRDFEDALQRECALDNGIGILVTRNTRDYPKAEVEILSPVDFMRLHSAEDHSLTVHA